MILDLNSVRRWGAPPEITDHTNGLDADVAAMTPEIIDDTQYFPFATEIQRRRPAIATDWSGYDNTVAIEISNNVACEGAQVWAIKECDSRICDRTHVVYYGPKVYTTSICTCCASRLQREPIALWCIQSSEFIPPPFFIMLLRKNGIQLPRDLMHAELPQIRYMDATCANLMAHMTEEAWISRPSIVHSCQDVDSIVATVERPRNPLDDPVYGPKAPVTIEVDLEHTPTDESTDSHRAGAPATDLDGAQAPMDVDDEVTSPGGKTTVALYSDWDPAAAHSTPCIDAELPATNLDGSEATLHKVFDIRNARLLADQRCADEIQHAMRHRTADGHENMLLKSLCTSVPEFMWSHLGKQGGRRP